jgi:DNA mismatch endonuclease (patch repair protein)
MARSKETTHKIMSAIKSKDTNPEIIFGKALWKMGLRYRKHYRIHGKPDFAFVRAKVAVFCDGDFWHGHNWKIRGLKSLDEELETYSEFWVNKIRTNIARDAKVKKLLKSEGWQVVRLWESDIIRAPERSAARVKRRLDKIMGRMNHHVCGRRNKKSVS